MSVFAETPGLASGERSRLRVDAPELQDNILKALDGSKDVNVRDYQTLLLQKALKENVRQARFAHLDSWTAAGSHNTCCYI